MKNLKLSAAMSVMLGVMSTVQGGYAQLTLPPTNSAPGSQTSDTRASRPRSSGPSSPTAAGISSPVASGVSSPHVSKGALPHGRATDTGAADTRTARGCSAAVSELEASRRLIDLLDRENTLLKDRLETETRSTTILTELNASRKAESEALKTALAAKTETLVAKNEVINTQQKLIDSLKAKKSSPWKRLGDILIGVAAGVLIR